MAALHLIQGKRYLFQRGDGCAVTYFRATYVSLYGGTGWSTMVCRDMESNQNSPSSDIGVVCKSGQKYVHVNANQITNAQTLLDVAPKDTRLNDDVLRYIDEFW